MNIYRKWGSGAEGMGPYNRLGAGDWINLIAGFFWKSISLNEIFSFWNPKISFIEMFHENKLEFNVKIHGEINISWNIWQNNFTVYHSL